MLHQVAGIGPESPPTPPQFWPDFIMNMGKLLEIKSNFFGGQANPDNQISRGISMRSLARRESLQVLQKILTLIDSSTPDKQSQVILE